MDLLHTDPEFNERLNIMRDQYQWIDERYDAERGFFVLREVGRYYIGVMPLMYTGALIYGATANQYGYMDRWCYKSVQAAIAAGDAWAGDWPNEPEGWHRHPGTGRRRENGDPSTEEVRM